MIDHVLWSGRKVMIGNMAKATLSTAPAFVLAKLCDMIDLDGLGLLADDSLGANLSKDGEVMVPAHLWGAG